MRMAGFRFLSADLIQETIAFGKIARPFIARESHLVLEDYLRDLRSIGDQPENTDHRLTLKPLWTIPSKGQYEADNKGKHIRAKIEGTWQLRVFPSSQTKQMEFCGIASTTAVLFDLTNSCTPFAKWKLELGDHRSPGCYIHAHIPWGFDSETPDQKPISIPRLPSIFITPMSAIEFVLGELFQDEWPQSTNRINGDTTNWYRLQKKWLQCLFLWYLEVLQDGIEKKDGKGKEKNERKNKRTGKRKNTGKDRGNEDEDEEANDEQKRTSNLSPWMTLKAAKPNGRLFVEYEQSLK